MVTKKLLVEINYHAPYIQVFWSFKIRIVAAPQMRQMRTGESKFAGQKRFDIISYKPGTCSFQHHEKLEFRMRVPDRVKMFIM